MDQIEDTKLKSKENVAQMMKFTLFSISAGVIQVITFTLLFEVAHLIYWPAYLTALILSVLWNFTLNRKFTFKSANNIPIAMIKVALYYAVFTPLSTWWGHELSLIGWNEYLILGLTMITNLVTEFLFTKYVVYRNSINSASSNEQK
ncbi:MAG: polysaccharide synthesis protein GtrA [Tenericutes bacterium GWC2_34_14]|nr:MAG: polysaccharide synthesis protein GtrA [Tenericutes bacterium GWA2_35_7]OHE29926.1 MAG: polysaccharide synthesis protein GtrA [Tenericutes bacterium GWC2_34_14]OHE34905.1 MAG: polysaccharide synthesis protein GtrA [Tenericutes bacterium GWE2_34_108]OHE37235.1 MAG: polysaccharide synthesis protein GtrA [Tenericutes bacterium GWF1_35_14]OHE39633.1 MAG: polysaccharide synthesis protein GtrA [Tenericutes bacterium GWF2_35_184]OHE44179.1 MAG: polysaccharide synthesis protein GtrA [Tenericute